MTALTREETVWLQAYCAAINSVRDYPTVEASDAVKHFKEYFPTPTAEDKQAVNSVKGVYVTTAQLAEAMKEVFIIGDHQASDRFKAVLKKLGLSE